MSGFLGDDQFNYGPLPQVKVVEEEALEYGVDQILREEEWDNVETSSATLPTSR
jgi:hypothetical protein